MRLVLLALIATGCGRVSFEPLGDVAAGFARTSTLTDEAAGAVSIDVELSAASASEVTVAYSTGDGTATHGTDFTGATTGTLVFAPGDTTRTITLDITADGIAEPDETFAVTLDSASGAILTDTTHTVTISAVALPRVSFETATSEAGEADDEHITVVLDAPSSSAIEVDYQIDTNADDLALEPGTLSFAPGETEKVIAIAKIGDLLDENNETATLSLHNVVNAVIGDIGVHDHLIVDDDPTPTIGFSTAGGALGEGTGQFSATVTLSAPSGRVVTVQVVRGEGSVGEADVEFDGKTLIFDPGETTQVVSATIISDLTDENSENFRFSLDGCSNCTIIGETGNHTTTIVDDDLPPTVAIETASFSISESMPTAELVVRLSQPSGLVVSVPVEVVGGTATAGDFSVPANVTFAVGQSEAVIEVSLVNDDIDELDETVIIDLGVAVNADSSGATSRTLTIQDDEGPPTVGFDPAQSDGTTDEGANGASTLVEYDIVLSRPSSQIVTVDLDHAASTATFNNDFLILSSLVVSFSPGEVRRTITLVIEGDNQPETDETISLSLASAVNAVLSAQPRGHTIVNDD